MSLTYRLVMLFAAPIVKWWGRLKVTGLEFLPADGPTVLIPNHDSAWDPVVVGVAAVRRRQVRALAKASLWKKRPVGWVLDHMGQIPIERGRGDTAALSAAIDHLKAGRCIGVFPEGTVSRGRVLRAQSGAGRLVLAVPGTHVVCVAVTGAVDIVRFPKRPRIRVDFFEPAGGQPQEGESALSLTRRTVAEIRERAPHALPGRRKKAEHYRKLAEQHAAETTKA
jgi:1-acyl-sn-glycerol-3-phosphate acyltransferase